VTLNFNPPEGARVRVPLPQGAGPGLSARKASPVPAIGSGAWAAPRPACIALSESASGVLAQHQRPQGAPAYDKHQRSRVSRTTSVSRLAAQELRGPTALRALRPLGFNALRRCAMAGLPPALEGFFIASTHGWE
jgi:hypothetical protein